MSIQNSRQISDVKVMLKVGTDGRGIESIVKTGSSGTVDTYTINYTDGTKSTFTVTNGGSARMTSYDGTEAGVDADNVQDAIDELSARSKGLLNFTGATFAEFLKNVCDYFKDNLLLGETKCLNVTWTGQGEFYQVVCTKSYAIWLTGYLNGLYSSRSFDYDKIYQFGYQTSAGILTYRALLEDKGSVSVTSDGVKTNRQLFNELYALIDQNKISQNTKLVYGTLVLTIKLTNFLWFEMTRLEPITYNEFQNYQIELKESGSNYHYTFYSNTLFTVQDFADSVPQSGIEVKLIY